MNKLSQPVYFQELYEYSRDEIFEKLNRDIIEKLQEYDIVEFTEKKYQFRYVGVLIINDDVIFSYPKYINNNRNINRDFNQVLKVIKKYKAENETLDYYENEETEEISFNLISLMIYFLEDYYAHGTYHKTEDILETNGRGEINWDRTINNFYPIIDNSRPYYLELYTKNRSQDLFNFFKLLHECIITECSRYLDDYGLLNVFDLTHVELSEKNLEDFGENDFILEKLEKEFYVEYNTHKKDLLKFMHIYVSRKNVFTDKNFLTLYGTQNYHNIWEKMCSEIFSDKLKSKLSTLKPKSQKNELENDKSIYDIIEYPKWILSDGTEKESKGKLKPDIITFYEDTLIILDAKYYTLIFEKNKELKGNPGISDITKQYLYQLALEDFRKDYGYGRVRNALLFPKYDGEIENRGNVKLKMFSRFYLEDIQILMLPAEKVNELYLANRKISLKEIMGILDE